MDGTKDSSGQKSDNPDYSTHFIPVRGPPLSRVHARHVTHDGHRSILDETELMHSTGRLVQDLGGPVRRVHLLATGDYSDVMLIVNSIQNRGWNNDESWYGYPFIHTGRDADWSDEVNAYVFRPKEELVPDEGMEGMLTRYFRADVLFWDGKVRASAVCGFHESAGCDVCPGGYRVPDVEKEQVKKMVDKARRVLDDEK